VLGGHCSSPLSATAFDMIRRFAFPVSADNDSVHVAAVNEFQF